MAKEIYHALSDNDDFLMLSGWPVCDEDKNDPEAEKFMNQVMEMVRGIRAAQKAAGKRGAVVAFGSLYLAGSVRYELGMY